MYVFRVHVPVSACARAVAAHRSAGAAAVCADVGSAGAAPVRTYVGSAGAGAERACVRKPGLVQSVSTPNTPCSKATHRPFGPAASAKHSCGSCLWCRFRSSFSFLCSNGAAEVAWLFSSFRVSQKSRVKSACLTDGFVGQHLDVEWLVMGLYEEDGR